jgi:hypothetical protein
MKKVLYLIILIVSINFSYAFAHSGRTDKNGGHYNRKTGQYHTHGGSSWGGGIIVTIIVGGVILYAMSSTKKK